MTVVQAGGKEDESAFLSSVEGEISFFRSIMRARPVGIHRYFHVLTIQSSIFKDTGRTIHIDSIWKKLRTCYDLDALDAIDLEAEGYYTPHSNNSTPISIRSPSPSENLSRHPFFKEEFSLPYDESFEILISQRRMRDTVSAPSSPIPPPESPLLSASTLKRRNSTSRKRGKSKSKLSLAGLVGGDSDSSALTQESGDEGPVTTGTPRESVLTGTDAGTDYAEDFDVDMREPSPARSASPKPTRGRPPKNSKRGRGGATRGSSTRAVKKRKR